MNFREPPRDDRMIHPWESSPASLGGWKLPVAQSWALRVTTFVVVLRELLRVSVVAVASNVPMEQHAYEWSSTVWPPWKQKKWKCDDCPWYRHDPTLTQYIVSPRGWQSESLPTYRIGFFTPEFQMKPSLFWPCSRDLMFLGPAAWHHNWQGNWLLNSWWRGSIKWKHRAEDLWYSVRCLALL